MEGRQKGVEKWEFLHKESKEGKRFFRWASL